MKKNLVNKEMSLQVILAIKEVLGLKPEDRIKMEVPCCKKEDFVEGFKFVFNDRKFGEFGINGKIATVTYRRGDVVFYIVNGKKKEEFFQIGSFISESLEPVEYIAPNPKEHYNYVSRYNKTKIKYK